MTRVRLRDLGIIIGRLQPGPNNAITDVPGVLVGHHTLIYDTPTVARTGVTVVVPRDRQVGSNNVFVGIHSFNGNGEMTGSHAIEEFGILFEPIGITNTNQVGLVRDSIIAYSIGQGFGSGWYLPTVAETYDGYLNDINAFHLTKEHIYQALGSAKGGRVPEGNVGGGTGMICHEFKGGIGTASRQVPGQSNTYMIGVLVQANYGLRRDFRVDGIPVGRLIGPDHTPLVEKEQTSDGSIIVIIATDAPLLPIQCKRLAQRATVGLARVGGIGHNGSGDIFLAFATGNELPYRAETLPQLTMLPHHQLNPFFDAVAEATEEAILNALTSAETMSGYQGRTVRALPLDELQRVMAKHQVLS